MALWGKSDTSADAPKNATATELSNMYFVDETEAQVASNRAKGIKTPGWNTYNTYTDSDGNTRHKVESLVPMKVSAVDAGDLGMDANTTIEDTTVADS